MKKQAVVVLCWMVCACSQAAPSAEDAQAVYGQRQAELAQWREAGHKALQTREAAQAALNAAELAQQNACAERDRKLEDFRAAQALETRGYSINEPKHAYYAARDACATAEKERGQRRNALLAADADMRQANNEVQHAAQRMNDAALQVAQARLARLRRDMGHSAEVEARGEAVCGGQETMDTCKARALQDAQSRVAAKGAAVLVDTVKTAEFQSGAAPRLQKEIRTRVTCVVFCAAPLQTACSQDAPAWNGTGNLLER